MPDERTSAAQPRLAGGRQDHPDRLIFVHGSLGGAQEAFTEQKSFSAIYDVLIAVRRGYDVSAEQFGAVDLSRDADDVIEAMPSGAHLVGTSTGGVVAMIAAGRRPDLVRSLTVIEPPAFAIAADNVDVREAMQALRHHWTARPNVNDREFLQGFFDALRMTRQVPGILDAELARGIALLRTDRLWTLDVPVGALRDAAFPKLVVSGAWSPVYNAVCSRLANLIGAELQQIRGFGHAVQRSGAAFNRLLARHIRSPSVA
jgi:pimeloyl-ACP methyl ester carboxylesterase